MNKYIIIREVAKVNTRSPVLLDGPGRTYRERGSDVDVDGSYTSLYRCASTWALRIASAAFAPRDDADATSFASPRKRSLFHLRIFRCDGPCFRDLPFAAADECPLSGICQVRSKGFQADGETFQ